MPVIVGHSSAMLLVGKDARVEAIHHQGSVALAQGAITNAVRADQELIVGADAVIVRGAQSDGRVIVQWGATVGRILAKGDVYLLGDCTVGHIRAGGDVIIVGSPKIGKLEAKGRISTRYW